MRETKNLGSIKKLQRDFNAIISSDETKEGIKIAVKDIEDINRAIAREKIINRSQVIKNSKEKIDSAQIAADVRKAMEDEGRELE